MERRLAPRAGVCMCVCASLSVLFEFLWNELGFKIRDYTLPGRSSYFTVPQCVFVSPISRADFMHRGLIKVQKYLAKILPSHQACNMIQAADFVSASISSFKISLCKRVRAYTISDGQNLCSINSTNFSILEVRIYFRTKKDTYIRWTSWNRPLLLIWKPVSHLPQSHHVPRDIDASGQT